MRQSFTTYRDQLDRTPRTTTGHLTEADITHQIRSVLKQARVFHWKQWQGPMSQPKGVADILGIYQGRFLAIEVKRPGGAVRPEQVAFLDRVNREGGRGFIARSVDDVIRELQLNIHPLFREGCSHAQ